jgi:nicotinamidase-related amidase
MKIALLIIDMQKIFLDDKKNKIDVPKACEHINYAADLLRSKGHCIVIVQDMERAEEVDSGMLDIIPEIKIESSDIRLSKIASNSFWDTDLEKILREQEIEMVIVSGYTAENCVLFTYNGAIERGFKTVILQDGILSSYEDAIVSTYRDRNLISYPVIEVLTK